MWITQTYLKSPEPNAGVHLYYLFDKNDSTHMSETKKVQDELASLSSAFPEACILLPNQDSADRIEAEVRQRQQDLWQQFRRNLPGIIVSRKPIEQLDFQSDEVFYLPLHGTDSSDRADPGSDAHRMAEKIQKLRRLVGDELSWQYKDRQKGKKSPSNFVSKLVDAVEFKIGFGGLRLDLKKLIRSQQQK